MRQNEGGRAGADRTEHVFKFLCTRGEGCAQSAVDGVGALGKRNAWDGVTTTNNRHDVLQAERSFVEKRERGRRYANAHRGRGRRR